MQVFKAFMKIILKNLRVSMIYIVIFVSICVAMTAVSSKSDNSFQSSELKISITDLDNTPASESLADYIAKSNKIVDVENDKDSILDALYYGNADIVLTINKGFSDSLLKGETDSLLSDYRIPGSYNAELFDTQINRYISMVTAYTISGLSVEQASEKAAGLAEDEVRTEKINFSKVSNAEYDNNIKSFFQYLSYILVVTLISGLCPVIMTMTRKEIRNRINCSNISTTNQMLQIILSSSIFAVGLYVILMIVAAVMYKSMLFSSLGLLAMLNGFVYLIFSLMLTMTIAVIAPAQKAVNMISNVISLGMSFLCGVFVPQELLGNTVLSIGKFLPAYWYVRANNMLSGCNGEVYDFGKLMMYIGIELAFSIALFCITLLISKIKKQSKSIS